VAHKGCVTGWALARAPKHARPAKRTKTRLKDMHALYVRPLARARKPER